MNEPRDPLQVQDALSPFKYTLFWMKLILGLGFGASSYFILRFNHFMTWYVLAPILYLITILIVFTHLNSKIEKKERRPKPIVRFALNYTGTWIIGYFVLAIVMYYFGW